MVSWNFPPNLGTCFHVSFWSGEKCQHPFCLMLQSIMPVIQNVCLTGLTGQNNKQLNDDKPEHMNSFEFHQFFRTHSHPSGVRTCNSNSSRFNARSLFTSDRWKALATAAIRVLGTQLRIRATSWKIYCQPKTAGRTRRSDFILNLRTYDRECCDWVRKLSHSKASGANAFGCNGFFQWLLHHTSTFYHPKKRMKTQESKYGYPKLPEFKGVTFFKIWPVYRHTVAPIKRAFWKCTEHNWWQV